MYADKVKHYLYNGFLNIIVEVPDVNMSKYEETEDQVFGVISFRQCKKDILWNRFIRIQVNPLISVLYRES